MSKAKVTRDFAKGTVTVKMTERDAAVLAVIIGATRSVHDRPSGQDVPLEGLYREMIDLFGWEYTPALATEYVRDCRDRKISPAARTTIADRLRSHADRAEAAIAAARA